MGVSPRKPHLLETHLVLITLIQYEEGKRRKKKGDKKNPHPTYPVPTTRGAGRVVGTGYTFTNVLVQ